MATLPSSGPASSTLARPQALFARNCWHHAGPSARARVAWAEFARTPPAFPHSQQALLNVSARPLRGPRAGSLLSHTTQLAFQCCASPTWPAPFQWTRATKQVLSLSDGMQYSIASPHVFSALKLPLRTYTHDFLTTSLHMQGMILRTYTHGNFDRPYVHQRTQRPHLLSHRRSPEASFSHVPLTHPPPPSALVPLATSPRTRAE
jgi:hypothetical protein